jgi:hypothetical protein
MEIPISGKYGAGKVLLIDEEDLALLQGRSVFMTCNRKGSGGRYPAIWLNGTTIYVHRLVAVAMGLSGEIDHENRDKCDARRCNLREVTSSQNQRNQGLATNNTSRLKGVSWYKRSGKWQVHIWVKGRHEYLGVFTCKFEAARAYDRRALEVEPIHAATNLSLGLLPESLCQS